MRIPALVLPILLAGCAAVTPQVQAPTPSPSSAAGARQVEEKSDLLEFNYAYPGEAAAIPLLATRLEAELGERRRDAAEMARQDRADRPADAPFFSHFYQKIWTVAGKTPRMLSLQAELGFFTGGAHPNTSFDAILWDRQANRALPFPEWFVEPQSALAAIERSYCPALDEQRLEKRGGERMPAGTWETDCPSLAKHVVVPADSDRDGRLERLRVLLPPYEAGPYAEGEYVVEVPVSDALIGLIKPDLRASFEVQLPQ